MKFVITETQHEKIIFNNIPLSLLRRVDMIKGKIPGVVKLYDVDEYDRVEFIDEVLHQLYDEIDYNDINDFFDYIKPLLYDYIGKIYDRKVSFRIKRRK